MLAERPEGFLRAVGRAGEPVRAEADPGEERYQRQLMEDAAVVNVFGAPKEERPEAFAERRLIRG